MVEAEMPAQAMIAPAMQTGRHPNLNYWALLLSVLYANIIYWLDLELPWSRAGQRQWKNWATTDSDHQLPTPDNRQPGTDNNHRPPHPTKLQSAFDNRHPTTINKSESIQKRFLLFTVRKYIFWKFIILNEIWITWSQKDLAKPQSQNPYKHFRKGNNKSKGAFLQF